MPLVPMLVTLFPIVTLVRLGHLVNASVPILVTLFGIVTPDRVQTANEPSPMVVTGIRNNIISCLATRKRNQNILAQVE